MTSLEIARKKEVRKWMDILWKCNDLEIVNKILSAIDQARKDERERCAEIAENFWEEKPSYLGTDEIAEAIRRGES